MPATRFLTSGFRKQWFAARAHSCRLRKSGSANSYLRISCRSSESLDQDVFQLRVDTSLVTFLHTIIIIIIISLLSCQIK